MEIQLYDYIIITAKKTEEIQVDSWPASPLERLVAPTPTKKTTSYDEKTIFSVAAMSDNFIAATIEWSETYHRHVGDTVLLNLDNYNVQTLSKGIVRVLKEKAKWTAEKNASAVTKPNGSMKALSCAPSTIFLPSKDDAGFGGTLGSSQT